MLTAIPGPCLLVCYIAYDPQEDTETRIGDSPIQKF